MKHVSLLCDTLRWGTEIKVKKSIRVISWSALLANVLLIGIHFCLPVMAEGYRPCNGSVEQPCPGSTAEQLVPAGPALTALGAADSKVIAPKKPAWTPIQGPEWIPVVVDKLFKFFLVLIIIISAIKWPGETLRFFLWLFLSIITSGGRSSGGSSSRGRGGGGWSGGGGGFSGGGASGGW